MLFAGTIQVAVAFRRFQCILCRLVLRMPISMACLNLYTLAIFIQGCFDNIARSDATHIRRKRWVHGLDPKVAKPIVHEVGVFGLLSSRSPSRRVLRQVAIGICLPPVWPHLGFLREQVCGTHIFTFRPTVLVCILIKPEFYSGLLSALPICSPDSTVRRLLCPLHLSWR
jgi:hypothetical protein